MPRKFALLSVDEHARDSVGMTYVYPVVSRRARGVSIGINLNPNNACNWKCVYCQVPGLIRGGPPPIDLAKLELELNSFLSELEAGNFMKNRVPLDAQTLRDVAFSGNGEPTMAEEFPEAVVLVVKTLRTHSLLGKIKLRLITNGSQVGKAAVRTGLAMMGKNDGEVWFKLDAATATGMAEVNGVRISPAAQLRRLRDCAGLCPTWIQSCFFLCDGKPPSASAIDSYVAAVGQVADVIAGVHLYGIARPSMQPQAARLGRLPEAWFTELAGRLTRQGPRVTVNP
jgi:hypothetical protein